MAYRGVQRDLGSKSDPEPGKNTQHSKEVGDKQLIQRVLCRV